MMTLTWLFTTLDLFEQSRNPEFPQFEVVPCPPLHPRVY